MSDVTANIAAITKSVEELTGLTLELSEDRSKSIEKIRKVYFWLGIAIGITTVVALFSLWQSTRLSILNTTVLENQVAISEIQDRTSNDVLCPLYDIFLDSYRPGSPQAKDDPVLYEKSFDVIENGAVALKCVHTKRGVE